MEIVCLSPPRDPLAILRFAQMSPVSLFKNELSAVRAKYSERTGDRQIERVLLSEVVSSQFGEATAAMTMVMAKTNLSWPSPAAGHTQRATLPCG